MGDQVPAVFMVGALWLCSVNTPTQTMIASSELLMQENRSVSSIDFCLTQGRLSAQGLRTSTVTQWKPPCQHELISLSE